MVAHTTKRSQKGRIKSSTVAIYASVFVLFVSVIGVGYRAPQEVASSASAAPIAGAVPEAAQTAVNEVVAIDIAASVAKEANLPIAGNIAERAVSARIQSEYASTGDGDAAAKPTILAVSSASRNITTYTVVEGDTVASIAAKFGVSENTIKWANDLSGNTVAVGSTVEILPRDGITYTVKDGDTIEKLAERYKADASLIVTYNDLELNGLTAGLKIVIPSGVLPETERPGYVAPSPVYSTYFVSGFGAWSGSVLRMWTQYTPEQGGYAAGNCTVYAYVKRAQMGRPLPATVLGNAYTWATQAARMGYTVNKSPAAGAVIQSGNHVGIVEEVLPNGDLRITDMNYGYRLHNVAERIIPASTTSRYMYIH
ncbi:MAG: LysM peptidoglycan-binding domain-containing protein [Candidatus Microsaccharimonas sp.]